MSLQNTLVSRSLAWRYAALLAVAGAAFVVWTMPDNSDLLVSAPSTVDAVASGHGNRATADRAAYPEIGRHPLFYATRQPWTAGSLSASLSPSIRALSESYVLIGIALSGNARIALLEPISGGKTVTLTEGQALDGWILRAIGTEGLHFERDGAVGDIAFPAPQSGRKSARAPG